MLSLTSGHTMVVTEDVKQTAPVIIAMVTDLGRALYIWSVF